MLNTELSRVEFQQSAESRVLIQPVWTTFASIILGLSNSNYTTLLQETKLPYNYELSAQQSNYAFTCTEIRSKLRLDGSALKCSCSLMSSLSPRNIEQLKQDLIHLNQITFLLYLNMSVSKFLLHN